MRSGSAPDGVSPFISARTGRMIRKAPAEFGHEFVGIGLSAIAFELRQARQPFFWRLAVEFDEPRWARHRLRAAALKRGRGS